MLWHSAVRMLCICGVTRSRRLIRLQLSRHLVAMPSPQQAMPSPPVFWQHQMEQQHRLQSLCLNQQRRRKKGLLHHRHFSASCLHAIKF